MPIDYYRGIGYYNLGDYNSALHSFLESSTLAPENPLIKNNLAAAYYRTNNIQEAESLYKNMSLVYPNYLEPQINYIALLANMGDDSSAIRMIRILDGKHPGRDRFFTNKGLLP